MKKKIIGIFVCILLISTAIPVIGIESLQSEQDIALSTTTFQNMSVTITRPKGIYILDRQIIPFPWTIIIGPITIEANATIDEGIIDRAELNIYDKKGDLKEWKPIDDPDIPIILISWNATAFGKYTMEIIVFDEQNNSANDTINVWKFF